mmetsp:Transcript_14756/g.25103  ORF Transcript_14756/g.25103 Transcript_14756/m.25103 type:complete len:114 (+) Transcript_14756:104-445(+)
MESRDGAEGDDIYKAKRLMSLDKDYEIQLEVQRQRLMKNKKKDPMEAVVYKLRRGLRLDVNELEIWTQYNFMVLREDDKEVLKGFIERKRRINTIESSLFPFIAFSSFAIFKY